MKPLDKGLPAKSDVASRPSVKCVLKSFYPLIDFLRVFFFLTLYLFFNDLDSNCDFTAKCLIN